MSTPARVAQYKPSDELMRSRLDLYCKNLVKIGTKKPGELIPFIWNEAQHRLHARLEKMRDERGLVRAIILKARQLGVSTYIGARYYHRSTLWLGHQTYILTHEDKATQQLFGMVKRMHEHMPKDYRPATIAANENELKFGGFEGGYRVGTAKNVAGSGRSLTLQLFHGSEVGFWPQADSHFSGVVQAVGMEPGTEILLESTANGIGGTFYEQWGMAEAGLSDFMPVFIPWTIEPGYTRALDARFTPGREEEEYQRLHKLTDEQLCWLHYKNIELNGKPGTISSEFKKEYPATAAEAFAASSGASLIADEYILAARRREIGDQSYLPRVLGVDVAYSNKDVRNKNGKLLRRDATRMVDRQGRKMGTIDEHFYSDDPVFLAGQLMRLLRDNPDIRKAYVDASEGMGAGIVSICHTNGFQARVTGVRFGGEPQDPSRYLNRRGEMHARQRDWFKDPGGCSIPDSDIAHKHLAATHAKHDVNGRLVPEPKSETKKRLGESPDWADAGALTFAEILAVEERDERPKWMLELEQEADGDWSTA